MQDLVEKHWHHLPAREVIELLDNGRVKVELTFTAPDEAPTVDVLEKEGGAEFVESVQKHVRTFRAPCLALADTPAALTIEFVFKPDARRAF